MTIPIGTYQVIVPAGGGAPRIAIRDEANRLRGHIEFVPFHAIDARSSCSQSPDGLFTLQMPDARFNPVLSLLRHERPLYVVIDEKAHSAVLRTGEEPPGESERS
jgi:hypothetical protein